MRTALVIMLVLGTTTPTWAAQRLVVLPSQWLEGAKADISPRLVDDAILAAAQAAGTASVLGVSDLEAVVGLERQRDLLGCSEVACYGEIAGALGADQVLSVQLGRAGAAWVVSLKKLQVQSGNPSVEARLVETVAARDGAALLQGVAGLTTRIMGGKALPAGPPAQATPPAPAARTTLDASSQPPTSGDEALAVRLGVRLGRDTSRVLGHLLVTSVLPHSPAARAGILPGDELAMVEGKSVDTADDVLRRLASAPAGKIVTLSISRDQDWMHLRVKVGPSSWPTRVGLMVEKATAEQRRAEDTESGAYVISVDDDGIAAYAGIERGDILLSIEGARLTEPSVLVEAVRSARAAGKESVSVELARRRARLSVALPLH